MFMEKIEQIKGKKVFLKVDLGSTNRFGIGLNHSVKSIEVLKKNGNTVCIAASYGPGFLKPGLSCKPFVNIYKDKFALEVSWLPNLDDMNLENGKIYLLENVLLDQRELDCDAAYIEQIKSKFDILVIDSICNMDANYATSQGLLRANMPHIYGKNIEYLTEFRDLLWSSRIGLILGNGNVSYQLRFIQALMEQIEFVAVGGEAGLLMMGRGKTIYGHIKKDLMCVTSALRQHQVMMLYPVDVVAYSPESQRSHITLFQELEEFEEVFDLGGVSIDRILSQVDDSTVDLVFLFGAVGQIVDPRYSRGSESLIRGLAKRQVKKEIIGCRAVLVANQLSLLDSFDYFIQENTMNMRFLMQKKLVSKFITEIL